MEGRPEGVSHRNGRRALTRVGGLSSTGRQDWVSQELGDSGSAGVKRTNRRTQWVRQRAEGRTVDSVRIHGSRGARRAR